MKKLWPWLVGIGILVILVVVLWFGLVSCATAILPRP